MSLRIRIILTYALLVVSSFSFLIYLIMNDVRPRYLEAVEESLVDTAELLAAFLSQQSADGVPELGNIALTMQALSERRFSARIYAIQKNRVALRVYVTDATGKLLYDSSGETKPGTDFSQWRDIWLTLRGAYGARSTKLDPKDPASRVMFVAAPIIKEGNMIGVVSVGKPTDSISFLIAIAEKRFFLSLVFVGVSTVILAVVLSFWLTRPLNRLIASMHNPRQGKTELSPAEPPEIKILGTALDEMRTRLEGKNYIEDYVRALTHELKSPLTGIKGAGEILREHVSSVAGAKFLNNIDAEVNRLHSLVERMLSLSRVENIRAIAKTPIPLEPFFRSLSEDFAIQAAAKSLSLRSTLPDNLVVEGDPLLLRQAFDNLMTNAIDFSPPGTPIEIRAEAAGSSVTITLRDYGPGIPDFALDKVFDKFFSLERPDAGKKSTGLGLPFVKEILTLHEGDIQITPVHPGLEVCVVLPARISS